MWNPQRPTWDTCENCINEQMLQALARHIEGHLQFQAQPVGAIRVPADVCGNLKAPWHTRVEQPCARRPVCYGSHCKGPLVAVKIQAEWGVHVVQASAQATATTTPRATPTTLMAEPEPEPQPQPLRSRSKSRLRKCFLSQPHNSSVLASIIKHDNTRAEVACFTLACRVCTYTTASGAGVIDAQMSGCGWK
jgi:hypothetical protein